MSDDDAPAPMPGDKLPEQHPRTDPPHFDVPIPDATDPDDPAGPASLARAQLDARRTIAAARLLFRVARHPRADASWPALQLALSDHYAAQACRDDAESVRLRTEIKAFLHPKGHR
jgi:hypothetical protein